MQSFDFDAVHNRIGTGSIKYEQNTKTSTQSIIPMWIANMDFKIPPAVENALISSADHGIFGYTMTDTEYDDIYCGMKQLMKCITGCFILTA